VPDRPAVPTQPAGATLPASAADGRTPLLPLAWLFVFVTLIIFLRSPSAFLHPMLPYEDGTHLYAFYVGNPDLSRLFRFYAGYISLGPNAAGYLISNAAPVTAPYLMPLASLVIAGAAMTVFALRRFRCIIPSDAGRVAICVAIAAMPLGDYGITSYLSYSLWNLLLIALLLTAAPLPASRPARLLQFAFTSLAIWSNPLSVVFIPLCLGLLYYRRTPEDRAFNAGLIAVTLLYIALGIRPETGAGEAAPSSIAAAVFTPRYILDRVVFETFAGSRIRAALHNRGLSALVYVGGACLSAAIAAALYLLRHRLTTAHRRALAGAALLILALSLLSVVGRGIDADARLGAWNTRYFYIQRYALLLILAVAAALAIPELRRRFSLAIPAAAVVLFIIALNILERPFFTPPPARTAELLQFTRLVAAELDKPAASRSTDPLVFPKDGRWDIRVLPATLPD